MCKRNTPSARSLYLLSRRLRSHSRLRNATAVEDGIVPGAGLDVDSHIVAEDGVAAARVADLVGVFSLSKCVGDANSSIRVSQDAVEDEIVRAPDLDACVA